MVPAWYLTRCKYCLCVIVVRPPQAGVGGSAFYLLMWLLLNGQFKMTDTDALFVIFALMIPIIFVYQVIEVSIDARYSHTLL